MHHKPGHLARDCRSRPTERGGCGEPKKTPSGTKKVTADDHPAEGQFESLQQCLYSSDGVLDSGTDITITGGTHFWKV